MNPRPNSARASREFQTSNRPIATIRRPTASAAGAVVERKARSLNERRLPIRRRAALPGAGIVWAVIGYLAARTGNGGAPVAVRAPRPAPLEEESGIRARSASLRW